MPATTVTACPDCGFAAGQWSDRDAHNTLRHVRRWFDQITEGAADDVRAALAPYAAGLVALPDQRCEVGTAPPRVAGSRVFAAVHRAQHALSAAGRLRQQLDPTPRAYGHVAQVSASGGGVPKTAVARAEVTWRGLDVDRQSDRGNHGRPWQALCLWSAEVVDALAAEGHPIGYGYAGENITVAGILREGAVEPGAPVVVEPD